jgi:hypothetical protein
MEVTGLPLHALVVHAAVVLTPLAALLAVAFAVLPRWRWLTRWPAVLGAVSASAAVLVAKLSGDAMLADRPFLLSSPGLAAQIERHEQRGEVLLYVVLGFLVVTLGAAYLLGGTSGLVSGRGGRRGVAPALDLPVAAVLVLVAGVVLVWVVLTGDAGARAVWQT